MNDGLWRDHPATPKQAQLSFKSSRKRPRPTQADVLVAMLRLARSRNKALELPDIMEVGIAQHGARFNELRSRGYIVRNEIERRDGVVLSRYYLEYDPDRDGSTAPAREPNVTSDTQERYE